ncbi:integration host factor subunit beta [Candidatus Profftia tarda]|nr:integration host factor subunit beta [Candidatus Profftia tarda]
MTKSKLIRKLASQRPNMLAIVVEKAVKEIIDHMSSILANGERIEIRGFGSFSLHYRAPRIGRNPKTGDTVPLTGKYVLHFKPGKELRARANIYS